MAGRIRPARRIVAAALFAAPAAMAQVGWTLRDSASAPGARNGVVLAFDRVGARTILFGGADEGNNLLGDTWAWNGTIETWSAVPSPGPSPRSYTRMVYDELRCVIVLFGGRTAGDQISSETWEFNCSTDSWTQVALTGPNPGPRYVHTMAYDLNRARILLFGGLTTINSLAPNDTWAWDGAAWEQVAIDGPPARQGAAMSYDRERSATVIFGGQGPSDQVTDDTWEWMGDGWIPRTTPIAPVRRSYGAMAYEWANRQCILFGGYIPGSGPTYPGDTSTWDGARWRPRVLAVSPNVGTGFGFAYDSYRHVAVLYGGNDLDTTASDDTWELTMPPPCTADYNGDGFTDGIDYDQFNNDFEAGC